MHLLSEPSTGLSSYLWTPGGSGGCGKSARELPRGWAAPATPPQAGHRYRTPQAGAWAEGGSALPSPPTKVCASIISQVGRGSGCPPGRRCVAKGICCGPRPALGAGQDRLPPLGAEMAKKQALTAQCDQGGEEQPRGSGAGVGDMGRPHVTKGTPAGSRSNPLETASQPPPHRLLGRGQGAEAEWDPRAAAGTRAGPGQLASAARPAEPSLESAKGALGCPQTNSW